MNLSKQFLSFAAVFAASALMANPMQVTGVSMAQDSGYTTVTVNYTLTAEEPAFVRLDILTNDVSIGTEHIKTVSGEGYSTDTGTLISSGTHQIVWQARKDWPEHLCSNAQARVMAYYTNALAYVPGVYMVVNLAGGTGASSFPVSYTMAKPEVNAENRTTKLWLKRIEPCTFTMGRQTENEMTLVTSWPATNEIAHSVTLTRAFFAGVFGVTRKQYELVTGDAGTGEDVTYLPTDATLRDYAPRGTLSYNDIRGNAADSAYSWPATNGVSPASFMGILRAKTGSALRFDLPTEAQRECACRAGTSTPWNNGTDITDIQTDPELGKLGWYVANSGNVTSSRAGKQPVGQLAPNAWGLYDMHGNMWEWCLDRFCPNPGALADGSEDPKGATAGTRRILRGGHFESPAQECRSACRTMVDQSSSYYHLGFRVFVTMD